MGRMVEGSPFGVQLSATVVGKQSRKLFLGSQQLILELGLYSTQ